MGEALWGEYPSANTVSTPGSTDVYLLPYRFDESEDRMNARLRRHPARFRGTLEIKDLSWLTPIGRRRIEKDLCARDIQLHFQSVLKPASTLTLAQLYGPGVFGEGGMKVKIIVQCQKLPFSASYCQCAPSRLNLSL